MATTDSERTGPASKVAPAFDEDALRVRLAQLTLRDEHRLRRRLDRVRRGHGDAELDTLLREIVRGEAAIARRRGAVPAVSYPPQLPVSARRDDLLAAIGAHQVVIVAGETGSGKTTQLPKICLELGRGVRGAIAHTQPRRLAARTVAERIAEELGVGLGEAVGYAIRFSDRSSQDTLVRLVTDGLLLAEVQRDRLLRRYDTIIVDEAHERSLNIDFLLGYLHRLLPQRPDLKLVITSATIDPGRFSRHFGDAPVVEVSGRTYPVEVRYRPLSGAAEPAGADEDDEAATLGPDRDPVDAIGDAVEELLRDGPGDVLVFLSGEREIRDTAEALAGRLPSRIEILPLYARLSPAEQQRVFKPHDARRVVLATNVAETSLTVPGIGSVVDPGTARISRYSSRLKVQRLPIEPVSQASADQRKGRCGRQSDGICIRLYAEQDFAARPAYTDPEILRTSLAAVILQMEALGLGEVEDFPFLDPPDRRQVRDGIALLHELGALDPAAESGRRLTALGRRLAQLPVDPRLGRMVLEADRLGCADEVIVIAAALSIQDPRVRPLEERPQADQMHARFRDERSDFVAFLNLWRHLREQQRELSGNQFRKRCRTEFLHYLRIREWQDLAAQLRQAARGVGVTINSEPADPQAVHVALLSGLLSHVGLHNVRRREYDGARGARFAIQNGSVLARRQPAWVMVAELVETGRLWGRTAAQIQPSWIEPLAGHLLKVTHEAPHWERKRGSVVATERATLFGLPVVAGRKVAYGPIDPELSRELFIRCALVEGDWATRHAFVAANAAVLEELEQLEHRARRRDILAGDEAIFAFYDQRIPDGVVSVAHFDAWWKRARRTEPDLLSFPRDLLVSDDAADLLDPRARPDSWRQGDLTLRLSYRFEPGDERDGVTVHVPLEALPELRPDGFDWLVPGLRHELVVALIRSLPKELRRPLVPIPDVATQVVEQLRPRKGRLVDAVARELDALRGVRVSASDFDLDRLPAHLRMSFCVEDEHGEVVARGEDLDALRAAVAPRMRAALAAATVEIERSGLRDWDLGELPRTIELAAGGARAYPALADEGDAVGVRAFETPEAQRAAMHAGTRRLLVLTLPSPVRAAQRGLDRHAALTLAGAPHGGAGALIDDAVVAALDRLIDGAGGPAWDEAGFVALRERVGRELADTTARIVAQAVEILDAARDVRLALDALAPDPALREARLDVAAQLGGLVFPGFVAATGAARLPDVTRYLRGAQRRLERLPDAPAADRDRMRVLHELEADLRRRREAASAAAAPALREVAWMLQELRVSHFAQGLGVRGQISAKRVRKALETSGAGT
ncbi:MAG: ATP-dependent helicase HrpA [Solirubrobacteraceae bacterium]|nr:ATP-dependent helicase HrpA [Solirubrobacteraceae bacterium]